MSWKGPYAPTAAGQRAAIAASLRAASRITKLSRRAAGLPVSAAPRRIKTRGRMATAGGELKFFDTTNAFAFDTTAEVPATGQLNLIPQGVTESTRVGRKCVIRSIHMKGIVLLQPAASALSASTAYLYVVLDKQANGAAATPSDVYDSANLSQGFRNLANSQRFQVLKAAKWTLQPSAGVSAAFNNVARSYEFYLKVNIPIEFSSTTGAITEIRSNNIFLLAGSDGQTDDLINLAGRTRVRFSDN